MIPKVETASPIETVPEARPVAPVPEPQASAIQPPPPPQAVNPDLRLIIEEDGGPGSYVYKTIDRRTGEVVNQFPREEILRIRHSHDYSAGTVVKAEI
ncbi:MAG: flaG [Caulobacter sp.]|nr:flaG [Caulobacter sp.]